MLLTRISILLFALFFACGSYGQVMPDTVRQIDSVAVLKGRAQINSVDGLRLSVSQIEAMPKMMGMADPLKAVRFLPGFGNGGDANGGLFYRGLSSSNNGYYYNGVEVHNPSHLFGLFPVFNTQVLREVQVHSLVAPGRYLGKLSGYIDMESDWRIGDTTIVKGDLSLLHGGLGARVERDSSWMLELFGRNTFMNRTLWPVARKVMADQEGLRYDLYDLNMNAMLQAGRNRFKVFAYTGRDQASFGLYDNTVANKMNWGNAVMGASQQVELSAAWGLENRVGYSEYGADIVFDFLGDSFSMTSRQRNLTISSTLSWATTRGDVETGIVYSQEGLSTQMEQVPVVEQRGGYSSRQRIGKYFVRNKYRWSDKLETDVALHTSLLSSVSSKLFVHPTLLLVYHPFAGHSLSAGAAMGFQPTHQIAISSINLPVDYVVHSSDDHGVSNIKELSGGYRYTRGGVEFSIDGYYRWLSGLKEFDGNIIELHKEQDLNRGIISGHGRTYGVDLFTKVSRGRNYLTVNYGYSRSFRQFDDINRGGWYRYIYDRPHNLSVVNAYRLSSKVSLSASFVYSSGSAYTPTIGLYHFNNSILAEYGAKNSARADAYHRLDLGMEYLLNEGKRSRQKLGVSIINVYNRTNPIYKYLTYQRGYLEEFGSFKMIQKDGAYLPLMPSITYSIEFL